MDCACSQAYDCYGKCPNNFSPTYYFNRINKRQLRLSLTVFILLGRDGNNPVAESIVLLCFKKINAY